MSANHHPPVAESFDQDLAASSPNFLQIAWRRKSLIVLGAVIGCVLGAFYFSRQPSVYRSTARVLVLKKTPESFSGNGDSYASSYDDYLATHVVLLRSPALVRNAVKEGTLQELESLRDRDATGALMGGLGISRDEKTSDGRPANILTVAYHGPNPQDCAAVLKAVLASYKKYLHKTYNESNEDALKLIREASVIQKKSIEETRERYKKFRTKKKNLPLLEGGQSMANTLAPLQTQRSKVLLRRAELQVRLAALEDALTTGRDPTPFLQVNMTENAKLGAVADGAFFELIMKEKELREQYGEQHPQVQSVKSRLAFLKEFSTNKDNWYKEYYGKDYKKRDALAQAKADVESIKLELQNLDLSEKVIDAAYGKEADKYFNSINDEIELREFQKDIDRGDRLFESILSKISQFSVTQNMGGYIVDDIFPPEVGVQVAPRAMPIFMVALFCGLCGGIGLAWLADASDKSFRTPEEIRRRLGLTIIGHIPALIVDEESKQKAAAAGNVLDPQLVVHYRSRSIEAESFRGVRTAVYFKAQEQGMKILQVTSPNKGDGKSTVTANLAMSIAQSGKRVLLIDADFRRPRQHKIFGDKGDVGIVSVLTGDTTAKDALRPTAVPNLTLMPCGPRPSNPAELLTSPAFQELLTWLKDHFDYVLIDTPPLLAVSDPSIVAPRVDGVLLTIRVSRNGRPHAERAKELLATLNARVLGVIVNGVSKRGKHGYDKTYGYSYNYSYGYAYTYSYESDENKSYYQDPDGAAEAQLVGAGAAAGPDSNGAYASVGTNGRHHRNGGFLGWLTRLWQ